MFCYKDRKILWRECFNVKEPIIYIKKREKKK